MKYTSDNGSRKGCKQGLPWGKQETDWMVKWYKVQGKTAFETAELLNKKFWKGKSVRNVRAIEQRRIRINLEPKSVMSDYKMGKISPIHKKVWLLKTVAKLPDQQVADMVGRKVGTIKSMMNYMRNSTMLNEIALNDSKGIWSKEMKDIKSNQELMTRIADLQARLQRTEAVNGLIVDTIKDTIKALPPVKVPTIIIKKGMHKPETAILNIGDVHIGEHILKKDVANLTEYSYEKFLERIEVLRQGVIECVDIQRSKIPIKTLNINFLGDITSGEDIFLGQSRTTDLELTKQVFWGARDFAEKLLMPMAKYFEKVTCRCVWGNHGRGWGKPGQVAPRTNFDYILYMTLKNMFAAQKNVMFHIAECPIMLFQLPEAPQFTHLISHGNELNGWMGIPYYGMQRDMGKNIQMFNMPIHYWTVGHFHSSAKIDMAYGEQIINGAWTGGSELSVFKLKTKNRPKQSLFGFSENRGITWRYDIQLTPQENPVKDKDGFYTAWNQDNLELKIQEK